MGRRKKVPMLLGLPSPSLARLNKKDPEELAEQIERLQEEAGHVKRRLEKFRSLPEPPQERIQHLQALLQRLEVLERLARDRISGKSQVLPQSGSTGYSNSSRGYRNRRFTSS